MLRKILGVSADIAQVVIAITAIAVAGFAYVQIYSKDHRISTTFKVIERWDIANNIYTRPVINFVSDENNRKFLKLLVAGRAIELCNQGLADNDLKECVKEYRSRPYGFLLNDNGVIPSKKVVRLNYSLKSYLNVLDNMSILFLREYGDRCLLYTSYLRSRVKQSYFAKIQSYVNLKEYGPRSWTSYRKLVKEASKDIKVWEKKSNLTACIS